MIKDKPIVQPLPSNLSRQVIGRAIVSPCTGCKNNKPVNLNLENKKDSDLNMDEAWPCPKQIFYAYHQEARKTGDESRNYNHPVFDERLRGVNPVFPGLKDYFNQYAYVFLAFYSDNVDNGHNPEWDTTKIRCRGPYMLASTEKMWNYLGRIEQWDTVIGMNTYYYTDGVRFSGYAIEAHSHQTSKGYTRKQDNTPARILSGTSRNLI